jgi:hypothetical protein
MIKKIRKEKKCGNLCIHSFQLLMYNPKSTEPLFYMLLHLFEKKKIGGCKSKYSLCDEHNLFLAREALLSSKLP